MIYEATAEATKATPKAKKRLRLQQADTQVRHLLHVVGLALL